MKEKKITHYKVLKTCWGINGTRWDKGDKIVIENTDSLPYFKEIGLLYNSNYFEPVYKEDKLEVGDWVSFYSEIKKKTITARIKKLGSSYHYLTDGSEPFVYLLKKATGNEINDATDRIIKLGNGQGLRIFWYTGTEVRIIAEGREIQFKFINNLYCNENTFGDTGWKIQYNTVDIGCWKNITRTDLGKIIDTYNEIKQLVS